MHHGFVRAADGTFTEFDASGAGTGKNQGTQALSIDTAGDIAGTYMDSSHLYHGFVRAPSGTITTFDIPGAGAGKIREPVPINIGNGGNIAGFYTDTKGVLHGFMRVRQWHDHHLR